MDNQISNHTQRSVERLTIVVWVLFIITIINTGLLAYVVLIPKYAGKEVNGSLSKTSVPESIQSELPYNDFFKWPVDKKISESSAILLTKYQKNGDRLTAVVSEILKKNPGVDLYYNVGDEIQGFHQKIEKDTVYGDGQVVFMTGSPASFRFSTTYEHGRITGMGDMPISLLREKIKAQ
jgi:hypothetical protein